VPRDEWHGCYASGAKRYRRTKRSWRFGTTIRKARAEYRRGRRTYNSRDASAATSHDGGEVVKQGLKKLRALDKVITSRFDVAEV